MPKKPAVRPSKKRTTSRAREVRTRILEEAISAFACHGFEGARMRSIAKDAGVSSQLLVHHVKSKDALWQMTMEHILEKYNASMNLSSAATLKGVSASVRLKRAITDLVHFTASTPQLHRIMTLESAHPTRRMIWLAERFGKSGFEKWCSLIEAAQREGTVRKLSPARLRFAIIALTSVPFAVAAEYEYFTGKSPYAQSEVSRMIEMVCDMIFVKPVA
jgi:TetR/AcrR family transcriptional regulator